ncbi:MAG: arylsulfatase A-like enzyme [Planctomycetota bacterium]|jgi:arylsulfatase A-like enzyme
MHRLICALFLTSSLLLAGTTSCGPKVLASDEVDSVSKPNWRLDLAIAGESPALRTIEVVRDFPVDKDQVVWSSNLQLKVRGYDIDEQTRERKYQADVSGEQAPVIEVSFDQDPKSFNQVVLHVSSRRRRTFKMHLMRGDQIALSSVQMALRPRSKLQQVVFEFPGQAKESEPFTGMKLLMSKGPERASLYGLQLVSTPLLAKIAGQPGFLALNTIGIDARRSIGLSSIEPLETEIPQGYQGPVNFSLGMRELDARRAKGARLTVLELRGEQELQRQSFAFEKQWSSASIQLATAADANTRLRFELEHDQEREIVCILGQPQLMHEVKAPKTVIYITSDTHRADYLGSANKGVEVSTPFLDALASRGVLFTDCVSPANVTNPSHVAMMTGTPVRDTGILDNATPAGPQARTLAESFREAGYATFAGISATHLSPDKSGLGQGFDRVSLPRDGEATRDSVETMAPVISWLDNAQGRDLFVWLHIFDAHGPYGAPEDYNRPYYSDDKDPYDPSLPEPHEAMLPRWDPKVRDLAYVESMYRGEVSYLDARLEDFLSAERFQDAIIGFTADHGEWMLGPQHYFGHTALSPATLSVPLIVTWPGAPGGLRVDDSVQNLDLGRTLLDLAGLKGTVFPGENLVSGEPIEIGIPRFAMENGAKSVSIRTDQWFLVLSLRSLPASGLVAPIEKHSYQLYDFVADPLLQHDLREQQEQVALKLRGALIAWLQAGSLDRWGVEREVSQDEISQLAQLGYSDALVGANQGQWFEAGCTCIWCETAE